MTKITPGKQKDRLLYDMPEAWPDPVDGRELIESVCKMFSQYMVMSTDAVLSCSLWVFFTYALDSFETNPRLFISSPEKRCGKSTLLTILHSLVNKPVLASNVTSAVIFRLIEREHPTLLVDEADAISRENEDMRSILNSGHGRSGAYTLRCHGENHEPRRYSTWAPVALAGIKDIFETVMDRSVVIRLRRKIGDETVQRLSSRKLLAETLEIKRKILRWVDDYQEALAAAEPALPEALNDRARDSWEPLLAIADRLNVGTEARNAASALSGYSEEDKSIGIKLLNDLYELFEENTKWHTEDLTFPLLLDQS